MISSTAFRRLADGGYPFAGFYRPSPDAAGLLATAAPVAAMAVVSMCMSVADTLLAAALDVETMTAAGVASITLFLLVLVAACELLGPLGAAAAGLLRGLEFMRVPMAISLVGNWLIAAPVGVLLATSCNLGATGVWIGLAVGSATTASLTTLHLRRILHGQIS